MADDLMRQNEIRDLVGHAYRSIPTGGGLASARRFYSPDELAQLPGTAIAWSLGVGNPVRHAGLAGGDVVLDVGSGGGIDTILAARRVGTEGRVIGLDMLPEMCARGETAAKEAGVADHCEFRCGLMEDIPIDDAAVDVVISNGVINLSPRKSRVLAEISRVLKPGGRMCVADLTVDDELPPEVLTSDAAWAGCISGALSERVLSDKLQQAGLIDVELSERTPFTVDDVAVYPLFTAAVLDLIRRLLSEQAQQHIATSLIARAHKPATSQPAHAVAPVTPTVVQHLDDIPPTSDTGGSVVRRLHQVGDVELKVVELRPGTATPLHSHRHAHRAVVITGVGELEVDGRRVPLAQGDVVSIAPNQAHAIHSHGPNRLRLVCLDCLVG